MLIFFNKFLKNEKNINQNNNQLLDNKVSFNRYLFLIFPNNKNLIFWFTFINIYIFIFFKYNEIFVLLISLITVS